MHAGKTILVILALALSWTLCSRPARAQYPYYYMPNYTRDRAYRHYLTSPARVKTFSSSEAGRAWGYDTPFESGRFYQTPGYYREQTSQYGRERYEIPPQVGGTVITRPLLVPPGVYYSPPYYLSPEAPAAYVPPVYRSPW